MRTHDLYQKSPEAKALLDSLPSRLIYLAGGALLMVFLLVMAIAAAVRFPDMRRGEIFLRVDSLTTTTGWITLEDKPGVPNWEGAEVEVQAAVPGLPGWSMSGLVVWQEGRHLQVSVKELEGYPSRGTGWCHVSYQVVRGASPLWRSILKQRNY